MANGEHDGKTSETTTPSALTTALTKAPAFRRLVIILFLATGLVTFLLWLVVKKLGFQRIDSTGFYVVQNEGAAIALTSGDVTVAVVSVPAPQIWVRSGVTMKAKDLWNITASGQVHLGIHHLVECGIQDLPPRTGWISPVGEPRSSFYKDQLRQKRDKLCLDQRANYGQLLIALVPQDVPPEDRPDRKPRANEHWIVRFQPVLDGCSMPVIAPSDCDVYLTVNDEYCGDETDKCNFVGTLEDQLEGLDTGFKTGRFPDYPEIAKSIERLALWNEELKSYWASFEHEHPVFAQTWNARSSTAQEFAKRLEPMSSEDLADIFLWRAQAQWKLPFEQRSRIFFDDNVGEFVVQMVKSNSDNKG